RIEADFRDLAGLGDFLRRMEVRVEDFSAPLSEIANGMLEDVLGSFGSAGASLGLMWDVLSPATVARWGMHTFGHGPTGNLIASIHKFVRTFVAGVEATAPHVHLFEHGRHGVARIPTAGGEIRVRHSASLATPEEQPGREFLLLTTERQEHGIDLILDYALGAGNWSRAA